MRDFEDRSWAGLGDMHPVDRRNEDADSGTGASRNGHETLHERAVPSDANIGAGYRARRSDRPWVGHACRTTTWRAAAHGRDLAS